MKILDTRQTFQKSSKPVVVKVILRKAAKNLPCKESVGSENSALRMKLTRRKKQNSEHLCQKRWKMKVGFKWDLELCTSVSE